MFATVENVTHSLLYVQLCEGMLQEDEVLMLCGHRVFRRSRTGPPPHCVQGGDERQVGKRYV